jgi:hypothetical protein
MTKADRTLEALHEIRDEVRGLGTRLDATNARLDGVAERQDRLEQRQVQMEIRLATELVAVVGAVHEVRDAILGTQKLDATVADHELRLRVLERRTG